MTAVASETTTLRIVEDVLAEQLPPEWATRFVRAPGRPSGRRRDITLRIEPWDGVGRELAVIVKLALSPLDALRLVDTLDHPAGSVVVAPYLGERTRDVLARPGRQLHRHHRQHPAADDRAAAVRQ